MTESDPAVPALLLELVERGIWPADDEEASRFECAYPLDSQNDTLNARTQRLEDYGPPRVPVQRIRLIHPTASILCLYPPPFLPSVQRTCIWWNVRDIHPRFRRYFAEDEIDRSRIIEIGDFGHDWDTPIILDFNQTEDPVVRRLDFNLVSSDEDRRRYFDNHWIEIARSFDEFARLLGFIE